MGQEAQAQAVPRLVAAAVLVFGIGSPAADATEPCGGLGECKALVEINAFDGDIGFHFLMDGDDLIGGLVRSPNGTRVFTDQARGPLLAQKLSELFAESAEPLCWKDPEADPGEEIVTLEQFLRRWKPGAYTFVGFEDGGTSAKGKDPLTHRLPAAPTDLDFDKGVISWSAGDDLGKCASFAQLTELVARGKLPMHPVDVPVAAWEVVLEPDVEDGDPTGALKFSIRVPGDIAVKAVTVPKEYLDSLPADTPAKIEVGAIGVDDNATFWEVAGFCINEDEGCDE